MPLCGKIKPKPPSIQKVIIPKGMIVPGEITIIEIPTEYISSPIVIANNRNPQSGILQSVDANLFPSQFKNYLMEKNVHVRGATMFSCLPTYLLIF